MKKLIALVLALICILALAGCNTKSINYIIENKPIVTGIVEEVHDDYIIVSSEEAIVGADIIPMVMVNGELYMDTGHESTVEARCGMMDGEITSTVDRTEKPTVDDQSNFGTGYGYQYGSYEGLIEIYMNNKWCVFATEKALASSQMMIETYGTETITFQDKIFNKSDLSDETIQWLENYNSLSEEEQLAISSIPAEIYEFCGYTTAEETEVLAEY